MNKQKIFNAEFKIKSLELELPFDRDIEAIVDKYARLVSVLEFGDLERYDQINNRLAWDAADLVYWLENNPVSYNCAPGSASYWHQLADQLTGVYRTTEADHCEQITTEARDKANKSADDAERKAAVLDNIICNPGRRQSKTLARIEDRSQELHELADYLYEEGRQYNDRADELAEAVEDIEWLAAAAAEMAELMDEWDRLQEADAAEVLAGAEAVAVAIANEYARPIVADLIPEDEPTADPAADTTPVTVEAVPLKKKKQLAAWRGAVVEVLDVRADDGAAVVKFKGGARSSVPAGDLEPTTAKKTALPAWLVPGAVVDLYSALNPTAAPTRHTVESVKTTTIYFTDGYSSMINYFMHYGEPVAADDAATDTPAAPAADTTPAPVPEAVTADDAPTVTDADVLATAARIRAHYEAAKAEADRQAAADAFAAAINHYCDYLAEPEPLPEPPAVVYLSGPVPPSPRRRSWLPRPSRWLARLGRVAALVLLPLLVVLLTATAATDSPATAPDAAALNAAAVPAAALTAADDEAPALVVELAAVTVTADRPATPASQKSVSTPSSEKTALALAAAPASQKSDTTADDAAPVPDTATDSPTATSTAASGPAPLVCCAGTPWAYTMMNWA